MGAAATEASGLPRKDRPRPIIVRLARRSVREELLKSVKVRRGTTTDGLGLPIHVPQKMHINERLTREIESFLPKRANLGNTGSLSGPRMASYKHENPNRLKATTYDVMMIWNVFLATIPAPLRSNHLKTFLSINVLFLLVNSLVSPITTCSLSHLINIASTFHVRIVCTSLLCIKNWDKPNLYLHNYLDFLVNNYKFVYATAAVNAMLPAGGGVKLASVRPGTSHSIHYYYTFHPTQPDSTYLTLSFLYPHINHHDSLTLKTHKSKTRATPFIQLHTNTFTYRHVHLHTYYEYTFIITITRAK